MAVSFSCLGILFSFLGSDLFMDQVTSFKTLVFVSLNCKHAALDRKKCHVRQKLSVVISTEFDKVILIIR